MNMVFQNCYNLHLSTMNHVCHDSYVLGHLQLFSENIYFVHFPIGLLFNDSEFSSYIRKSSLLWLSLVCCILCSLNFAYGVWCYDTFFLFFKVICRFTGALWGLEFSIKLRISHSTVKKKSSILSSPFLNLK